MTLEFNHSIPIGHSMAYITDGERILRFPYIGITEEQAQQKMIERLGDNWRPCKAHEHVKQPVDWQKEGF